MDTAQRVRLMMGAAGIAIFALLFGVIVVNNAPKIAGTSWICDTQSLESFAANSSDAHFKADMEQQIAACKGTDLDRGSKPPSGSSPTVTVTVTATPAPKPAKHWYDPYDPTKDQFYASWNPRLKSSVNAYGPDRAVNPALNGIDMRKADADQAFAEQIYVIERDRMQTASAMVYLGLSKKDVNALIRAYVQDKALWNHDKKLVEKKLTEMKRRVVDTRAGLHTTTLRALPGDVPIVDSMDITYGYTTRWVVYKDAKGHEWWFRLVCKFQPRLFTHTSQVPQAPPTQTGITRTSEGTPVRLGNFCRLVNGKWQNVYNVKKRPGDLSPNSPKCSTPTTPSTPPTTPPNKCPGKTCQTPPAPPTNRHPAPSPTGPRESTPPVESIPANPTDAPGSGSSLPAPGSTPVPSQTSPAPVVTGSGSTSTPNTTITDPDGH